MTKTTPQFEISMDVKDWQRVIALKPGKVKDYAPASGYTLLEPLAGRVRCTAWTLDAASSLEVFADTDGPPAIFETKVLRDALKATGAKKGMVTLDAQYMTHQETGFRVPCVAAKGSVLSCAITDWPDVAQRCAKLTLLASVDAGELRSALQSCVKASADDQTRPLLNAVRILTDTKTGMVHLDATDGFRLVRFAMPGGSFLQNGTVNVPRETCEMVLKNFAGVQGDIDILARAEGENCGFIANGLRMYSRSIHGSFPNISSVDPRTHADWPENMPNRLTFRRDEMMRLVTQAVAQKAIVFKLVHEEGSDSIDVAWNDAEKNASDAQVASGGATGCLPVIFNPVYLRDALEIAESDGDGQVTIYCPKGYNSNPAYGPDPKRERHISTACVVGNTVLMPMNEPR